MTKRIELLIALTLIIASTLFFPYRVMAGDAKLIYPFNRAVISVSRIRVIGKTGDSPNLSLYVENSTGKSKHEMVPAGDYFSSEVLMAAGKNTISISAGTGTVDSIGIILADKNSTAVYPENYSPYYLHSKNNLTGECALCHPSSKSNVTLYKYVVQQVTCITNTCHAKFTGKFQHRPFQEGSCVNCHNLHGSENENFLKYSGSALCFSCHAEAENMSGEAKHIHFPVLKGQCTACHDPHSSNLEYHLKRDSIVGLCAGCHGTIYTSYKVLHEPVRQGDCIACHVPHISEHEKLLSADGDDLCFKCHTDRKEEFERTYVHEPVKKDCTLCHDPHGSETVDHLRNRKDENGNYIPVAQPIKELCLDCHRKLDPEVADQIENAKVRHDPVFEGECTICHTPHSTNYQKQLKAPLSEICYSCHEKIKEQITGRLYKHGPVRTDDCAQCHLVHGSANNHLLRANFPEEYTVKFDIDSYTLCFNCHNQETVLEKKTETTGFRNGKDNLHYFHVVSKGRSCRTCHEIHASDQEFHMQKKIPFSKSFIITLKFDRTPDGGNCTEGCHKPKKYDRIKPEINK